MNFYFQAASVLDDLDLKKNSLKGLLSDRAAQASSPAEGRKLTALVIETLKYKPTLLHLLNQTPLLTKERHLLPSKKHCNPTNLLLPILHDFLLPHPGRPGIQAKNGKVVEAVMRHGTRMKAELARLCIKKGVKGVEGLKENGVGDQIPRYARINTNLTAPKDLLEFLQSPAGGSFVFLESGPYPKPLPPKHFHRDLHIPNLLVFPLSASSLLVAHESYKKGHLILQDKASCFPSAVLGEGIQRDMKNAAASTSNQRWEVIDGTAAPGNKTTHLSALLPECVVHAFELSPKRFQTLEKMTTLAGCQNVSTSGARRDFLGTDPEDKEWKNVRGILLDPSCSGSGIVNRLDFLGGEGGEEEQEDVDEKTTRLQNLAAFQLNMIKHAMKFPATNRIVYSTCSIHSEEDEQVVWAALNSKEAKHGGWELALREDVLPTWERRGRKEHMDNQSNLAEGVICCVPGVDETNGFFVSSFVRRTSIRQKSASASTATTILDSASQPAAEPSSKKRKVNGSETDEKFEKKQKVVGIENVEEGEDGEVWGGIKSSADEETTVEVSSSLKKKKKKKKKRNTLTSSAIAD